MLTLGDLERSVMDLLWDASDPLSATDIRARLAGKDLAATTVLTVLSRLEGKGFVTRDRDIRPHLYTAASTRDTHMAELMNDVLGSARDREAVLARFVGQVSPDDAAALRRLLDGAR
ncbi:BlaI/MecI/CopY family transcriptional regulator [soil metagenome]